MSYIPLYEYRNRGWHSDETGYPHRVRYQAPCIGVVDDGYQITHDCAVTSLSAVTTMPEDLCGRPFRPGATFTTLLATSSPDLQCGRPFRKP